MDLVSICNISFWLFELHSSFSMYWRLKISVFWFIFIKWQCLLFLPSVLGSIKDALASLDVLGFQNISVPYSEGMKNRIFVVLFRALGKCRLTRLHFFCASVDTLLTLLASRHDPEFLRDAKCSTTVRSKKACSVFSFYIRRPVYFKIFKRNTALTLFYSSEQQVKWLILRKAVF